MRMSTLTVLYLWNNSSLFIIIAIIDLLYNVKKNQNIYYELPTILLKKLNTVKWKCIDKFW